MSLRFFSSKLCKKSATTDTNLPMQNNDQFQRWLTDYRGLIHRVVMLYAYTFSDQEDLYQEIATALWQSQGKFEGRAKETTWVYRVALNTALNLKRRKNLITDELTGAEPAPEAPESERLDWVYARLRTMSPVDRSLVLLYLDGNSYEDISEVLGLNVSNVGVKINRIKTRLRDLLSKETMEAKTNGH